MRQEDPFSPYLLLLVAETLAVSIRENPEIVGVKIGKNDYADGCTTVLSNLKSASILFQ